MSARMGIFQETLYRQFGKHSKEALFYNVSHFLNPGKMKMTELVLSSYVIPDMIGRPSDIVTGSIY